jgi:hypothetical protein
MRVNEMGLWSAGKLNAPLLKPCVTHRDTTRSSVLSEDPEVLFGRPDDQLLNAGDRLLEGGGPSISWPPVVMR